MLNSLIFNLSLKVYCNCLYNCLGSVTAYKITVRQINKFKIIFFYKYIKNEFYFYY